MKRFLNRGPWLHLTLWAWPWIGTGLGFAVGNRFLYPLFCVLPAYVVMVLLLRQGRRGRAVVAMLLWALGLALAGTGFTVAAPERAAAITLNGPEYRDEMFHWIRTGEGAEGDPSRFIPQHAFHITVFVLLSVATGSSLSMLFGTILMNYMSFYVGSLILEAEFLMPIVFLGWPVWSLVRVAAFVTLGVVLAEPLLGRLFARRSGFKDLRFYLLGGAAGLLVDALLKWLLAPLWQVWLVNAAGPGFSGL